MVAAKKSTSTKSRTAKPKAKKIESKEAEGIKNVSVQWDTTLKTVNVCNVPGFQSDLLYQQAVRPIIIQVFPEPPEITVKTPDDETDDDLSASIREDFIRLNGYEAMQYVLTDVCGYGCSVFSIGAGWQDNKFLINEIRHLDSKSFSSTPASVSLDGVVIVNDLMPGIIVNKEGETEVWQTDNSYARSHYIRINDPVIVRAISTPEPSGVATMKPVYEYINYIRFANNAQLQQISRVGAPIFMPKIADDVDAQDVGYLMQWSTKAVKTWSKDSAMVVPQGIEFPSVTVNENTVAKDTMTMWRQWVLDYINPMTMMQQTGNLGASDNGRMEMWANYISSLQDMCEHWLEKIFDNALEANGYEGYHVEIELKRPTVDRSDKVLSAMQVAGTDMTVQERRDALNSFTPVALQDTTDEVLAELKEQKATQQTSALSMFTNTVESDGFSGKEEKQVKSMEDTLNEINEATEKKIFEILNYGS